MDIPLTLKTLSKGSSAVITALSDPRLALKLCEMGCLPGKTITLLRKAPLGGPYVIQIADYQLCLRKEEAATVLLRSL